MNPPSRCPLLPALRLLLVGLALSILAVQAGEAPGDAAAEAERLLGQRIYREGLLPSGEPLSGRAQAGVLRSGQDAACITCHRRSGFGSVEGTLVIRPITGPQLWQTRPRHSPDPRIQQLLGQPTRPAYDAQTLARALREGRDASGRLLDAAMPRYALDEPALKALGAYLRTLSAAPAPGVTDDTIHLATVIQPGVAPQRRQAMLQVLQAFVQDKNAGSRSEARRKKAGTMREYRAYRQWVLHVWTLDGPPQDWPAQLEARYRAQPVFALVSGLGEQSWQPIHEFSERHALPCILPMTELPALQSPNFYTVYFSRGIALQAQALAQHLNRQAAGRPVVQVYPPEGAGAVAAAAFRAALADAPQRLEDRPLDGAPAPGFWPALPQRPDAAVVLWLDAQALAHADLSAFGADGAARLYLSATLLGDAAAAPAGALLTYPWALPAAREQAVQRTRHWLRAKGIAAPAQEEVLINTHFAIALAGDALAHLMDSFSREYFVERIEHLVSTTLMPSYFPQLSLGPDQRFASKGIYLVRTDGAPQPIRAETALLVP